MDQATLSRLENGRQPNPTVDTLWRYASAVGRQLVLTQAALPKQKNGKAVKSAIKASAAVRK
jgi:transcriptional regulator with XRE-family HTH domain